MELICVDDKFEGKVLEVFNKWNIKLPKEGQIVELLRVVKYSRISKVGLIVSPLQGQFIPGEIMGQSGEVEVSFDKKRFTTLLHQELTTEMLNEFKKQEKFEKVLVKPIKKDNNEKYNN